MESKAFRASGYEDQSFPITEVYGVSNCHVDVAWYIDRDASRYREAELLDGVLDALTRDRCQALQSNKISRRENIWAD